SVSPGFRRRPVRSDPSARVPRPDPAGDEVPRRRGAETPGDEGYRGRPLALFFGGFRLSPLRRPRSRDKVLPSLSFEFITRTRPAEPVESPGGVAIGGGTPGRIGA